MVVIPFLDCNKMTLKFIWEKKAKSHQEILKKKSKMGFGCFSIYYNLKQNYWNQDSIILTQE